MSCKSRYDPTLELEFLTQDSHARPKGKKKPKLPVKLFLLTTKLSIHYLIVAYFSVSKEQMYDRFNFERERNIWPTIILKLKKNKTKI
jgi:hypothetical protein